MNIDRFLEEGLKKYKEIVGRLDSNMSTKSYTVTKDEITFNGQTITDVISANEDTGEIHYYERHWSSGELVEDGNDPTGYRTCKDKGKVAVVKKYVEPTPPKDPSMDYPGYSGGYSDPYMGGCFPGGPSNPLAGPVFDGFLYADYMYDRNIRRSRDGKEIEIPIRERLSIGMAREIDADWIDGGFKRFIRSSEFYVQDIDTENFDAKGRWTIDSAWQQGYKKDVSEGEGPLYILLKGQPGFPNLNLVIYAEDICKIFTESPIITTEVWAKGEAIVDYIKNAVKD